MRSVVAFACAAFAAVASTASAGLVNPYVPAWAGSPTSQFAEWNSFTQATGGANLPDYAGSAPYTVMNFAPGAFITGTGNIYSINSALYVMVMGGTLNGATPSQMVMNVATEGSTINLTSVRLTLFDNVGNALVLNPTQSLLRYDAPAVPQGSVQTRAFVWDVVALPFAATGFRIEFAAGAPSMSLDAVRIDSNYAPIPAPGAIALLGISAMVARRRRS